MEEEIVINNEHQQVKPIENKKTGLMISAIITTSLAFIFLIVSMIFMVEMFSGSQESKALGLVLFLVVYGWFTLLPSLLLSIAGVITARFGLKSTKKSNKVVCIVFLVAGCVIMASVVILTLFIFLFPYTLANNSLMIF